MGVKPVIFFAWFLFLFFFPVCSNIFGLELGYNKVRYHDRAWQILESSHFQIYYYSPCEDLAKVAVQYAEAAFLPTCQAFDYVPKSKIPLFVYATGLEFQETNIVPDEIKRNPMTYADAGVDISGGDRAKERIKYLAQKTFNRNVLGGIGGFGALFRLYTSAPKRS